ncbi:hypothetical protein [Alicyclobacillus suci]|uniref:hypothetical protein n=1 Tax=Alicyclobacillus suci TaxID=2816080 RepID=UPI002E2D6B35|nr:hypothetical protein [Alicyclobacillus suci]
MRSEALIPFSDSEVAGASTQRIKVHIHCRQCGETFILRGARTNKGRVETGFKRCICNNEDDFDVEPLA